MSANMQITAANRKAAYVDLRKIPALSKQLLNHADLPEKYKVAKAALRECWRIDELKDIKDKHEAIAHYAKQAQDKALMYYAERIKLRAFERIGELLAEIPGGHREKCAAARKHGLAVNSMSWAIAASHIPKRVRDKLIESDPPPSTKALGEYGRRYEPGGSTAGFYEHTRIEQTVKHTPEHQAFELVKYLETITVDMESFMSDGCGGTFSMQQLARAVDPRDAGYVRAQLTKALELLDDFEQSLPKAKP